MGMQAPLQDCRLRRNMIRGFQVSRLALIVSPLEHLGESLPGELGAGPSALGVSSPSRSWEQDLAPPVQMTWISFPPLNSPARLALF